MSAGAGARATTGIFQRLPDSVGQVLTAAYFKGDFLPTTTGPLTAINYSFSKAGPLTFISLGY